MKSQSLKKIGTVDFSQKQTFPKLQAQSTRNIPSIPSIRPVNSGSKKLIPNRKQSRKTYRSVTNRKPTTPSLDFRGSLTGTNTFTSTLIGGKAGSQRRASQPRAYTRQSTLSHKFRRRHRNHHKRLDSGLTYLKLNQDFSKYKQSEGLRNVLANSKMIYEKIMENYEEGLEGVINVNKNLQEKIDTLESKLKSLIIEFSSNEGELRSVNKKLQDLEDGQDEESSLPVFNGENKAQIHPIPNIEKYKFGPGFDADKMRTLYNESKFRCKKYTFLMRKR